MRLLTQGNTVMTGADLRAARNSLKMTQGELASALGVTIKTISRWEIGVCNIQHPTILALALTALQDARAGGSRKTH